VKVVSGKDLARALEKKGWELKRVKGSHHIYVEEGNPIRVSIPIHGNRPLKTGLLSHLLKVTGLSENDV
jgi:predicted RNA binding protein YcfA (HicA-like mRNA interferase family)